MLEKNLMNIISSNCIGAQIYKKMSIPFNNPFMWSSIKLKDFIKIINLWERLNFMNFSLDFDKNEFGREFCSKIVLENCIKIYFTHHLLDKTATEPIIKGNDLYYSDILTYIKNKWIRRSNLITKEEPVFIYEDYDISPSHQYTNCDILEYIKLKPKRVLITCNKSLKQFENEKLKILLKQEGIIDTKKICSEILADKNLKKFILPIK